MHLNELAPDSARGLMPGLAYQLGIFFAAPTNSVQHELGKRFGYSWAMAGYEVVVMITLVIILAFGRENHGRSFHSGDIVIEVE